LLLIQERLVFDAFGISCNTEADVGHAVTRPSSHNLSCVSGASWWHHIAG
jgi:hypothetical protein